MEQQDKIDSYLLGEMTEQEIKNFENEISKNEELKLSVNLRRDIIRAIRFRSAKKMLTEIHAKQNSRKIKLSSRLVVSYLVAACFFMGCFIYVSDSSQCRRAGTAVELTQEQTRGASNEALKLIENKQYSEALDLINYELNKPIEKGNDEQSEYLAAQQKLLNEDYLWYKAIIYLRQGKMFKARKHLKNIVAGNGFYAPQAEELLKAL